MSDLVFGTSGWSYKEWVGPFYDSEKNMFSYYSRFFNTTEINSTFYRLPSKGTIYGLNRNAPPNFLFSAKMPKLITHEKRLDPSQNVKVDLAHFLELLEPLSARNRLGCILIQLPPSFTYSRDLENLKAFLELIPSGYEFAAEFRHKSWMRSETWNLLKKHNVAYCIVDEPLLPPEVHVTADFAYFRWHGRNPRLWYDYQYKEEELREWVPRIEEAARKVDKVYGYFNNHYHGYAVENCIEILEMLGAANPGHEQVKNRVISYSPQMHPKVREKKLEDFIKSSEENLEKLLLKLTDKTRMKRGFEIKDGELSLEESSPKCVRAQVGKYIVELNLAEKVLNHNCEDWRKGIQAKRICKHIVKILSSIEVETAVRIAKEIVKNKDEWQFRMVSLQNQEHTQ
ncbi:MAG: DUF72 domain-containing protein [Candidatus Bathyarchaeia archaeon]